MDIHSIRHALDRNLRKVVDNFHLGLTKIDVQVYPGPLETIPAFPCIVIGQPSIRQDENQVPCGYWLDWPLAVAVSRQEGTDHYQISLLDALWPYVYEGLDELARTNYSLDQTCTRFDLDGADFGDLSIGGKAYPAQVIGLKILGS